MKLVRSETQRDVNRQAVSTSQVFLGLCLQDTVSFQQRWSHGIGCSLKQLVSVSCCCSIMDSVAPRLSPRTDFFYQVQSRHITEFFKKFRRVTKISVLFHLDDKYIYIYFLFLFLFFAGNPHIGLLKHREKLYAFSSREAALTFASCPDKFISEVLERAKLSPELLQLLRLQQHVSGVSAGSEVTLIRP